MEDVTFCGHYLLNIEKRILPSILPVLLIGIGYADPGKWVATIEGGAHFGFDLVAPLFLFNFSAIICQYLSSLIGIVTKRDLVQICHDEYDQSTCIFLGILAELSAIALDLTVMLGITHALNVVFGVNLLSSIFLCSIDVVLFPLLASFLENWIARFLWISMVGFLMLSYVFGVLINQPEIPFSLNGMLTKLNGENIFTFMSLLGSSIMPHNFYVHSYLVKNHQELHNVGALCYDHFFSILCIFSGIFLVNYILMYSAANMFHSTGLVLVTFQDALSLMDQVFRSPMAPFGFLLVLVFSNLIVASTWNVVGGLVLSDLLKMDIPRWLHRVAIRILSILISLNCVWNSGTEGMYQLLLTTQVMVALLLPSSIIPLLRVASSFSIMGDYKISLFLELLSLVMFIGMLGLKMVFVAEMIFGDSEWVGILRWSMNNSTSVTYIVLLFIACGCSCLMLWLLATPLRSASVRTDAQTQLWGMENLEASAECDSDFSLSNVDLNLPETLDQGPGTDEKTTDVECSTLDAPLNSTEIRSDTFMCGNSPAEGRGSDYDGEEEDDWESPKTKNESGILKSDDSRLAGGGLGLGRAARRQFAAVLKEFWEQFYDLHGQVPPKAIKLNLLLSPLSPSVMVKVTHPLINYALFDSSRLLQRDHSMSAAQPSWTKQSPLLDLYAQDSIQSAYDSSERRYSSLRLPLSSASSSSSVGLDYQPATFHGYQIASYRAAAQDLAHQTHPSSLSTYLPLRRRNLGDQQYDQSSILNSAFQNPMNSNNTKKMQPERHHYGYDVYSTGSGFGSGSGSGPRYGSGSGFEPGFEPESGFGPGSGFKSVSGFGSESGSKKYHSLPDISGLSDPQTNPYIPDKSLLQWGAPNKFGSSIDRIREEQSLRYHYQNTAASASLRLGSNIDSTSMWARQPFERFGSNKNRSSDESITSEADILRSIRYSITKLIKFEGFDWLFRRNDGVDEDLIACVATWERSIYETQIGAVGNTLKRDDLWGYSIPHCGDGCVWKADLIVSFGVWCIHRILEMSLDESRPELWGKYTYVLNHLQGILELAFSKPRSPKSSCSCLQLPLVTNLNSDFKPGEQKRTTASSVLCLVKNIELAISQKKGRQGTAAGDVAFPKGKENLASVLKRYKRKLSAISPPRN